MLDGALVGGTLVGEDEDSELAVELELELGEDDAVGPSTELGLDVDDTVEKLCGVGRERDDDREEEDNDRDTTGGVGSEMLGSEMGMLGKEMLTDMLTDAPRDKDGWEGCTLVAGVVLKTKGTGGSDNKAVSTLEDTYEGILGVETAETEEGVVGGR